MLTHWETEAQVGEEVCRVTAEPDFDANVTALETYTQKVTL